MNPDKKCVLLETIDELDREINSLEATHRTALAALRNQVSFIRLAIQSSAAKLDIKLTPLPDQLRPKRSILFSIGQIAALAAGIYQVPVESLHRKNRDEEVVLPRQLAMYLAREHGWTLTAIGRHFEKDHGTVIHACRVVRDKTDINLEFRTCVQAALAKLNPTPKQSAA
jgi:chromosomal replication initiation ATPase DnaA